MSCRRVKPANLYVNEDLTQVRASILYALRQTKRRHPAKVRGCGSRDGRVFLLLTPPNPAEHSRRVFVDNLDRLEELCTRELGMPSSELLGTQRLK